MPKGAEILSVCAIYSRPYVWALVDPQAPLEDRYFLIVPTGVEFDPCGLKYIGTVTMHDPKGVPTTADLHVFDTGQWAEEVFGG